MRTNPPPPILVLLLLIPLLLCSCRAPDREALVAEGALGPYSNLVLSGDLCFVSGKIGQRGGSFAEETGSAIDAVEAALAEVDLTLADVLSSTVFLVDMQRYAEFNQVYAARFPAPYPARACVAVRELPAGAQVEIMVIARRR